MTTRKAQRLAIYGKGGIGKSTTTSNLAAALTEAGHRVIQIGCDPKSDSTNTLRGGRYLPTVLDSTRDGGRVRLGDISAVGFRCVLCIEAGGPVPGVGCAGRGINAAIEILHELRLFEELKPPFPSHHEPLAAPSSSPVAPAASAPRWLTSQPAAAGRSPSPTAPAA